MLLCIYKHILTKIILLDPWNHVLLPIMTQKSISVSLLRFSRNNKNVENRFFWGKYGLLWSNSVLIMFIGCEYRGVDTIIVFLSYSNKKLQLFWNLVARQPYEKSKIGHILSYIRARDFILGSIPPFSTMLNPNKTTDLKFEQCTGCKVLIHNFHTLSIDVFWAIKRAKIELFVIDNAKINIVCQTMYFYAQFKTKLFLGKINCEDPPLWP